MRRLLFITGLLVVPMAAVTPLERRSTFAVVVHHSNMVNNLRLPDLQALFAGGQKRWPDGNSVVLVERNPGSPAFEFLLDHVLNMSASEYKRRLSNIEYTGASPVNLKVLNSDGAACKFVFNVPGAIALIETESAGLSECSGVQVIRIEGKLPGEGGYRLR